MLVPSGPRRTISPSSSACLAASEAAAAAISGKRSVQSWPVRVRIRHRPRSRRSRARYPSNLISCSHSSPSGTRSTSVASSAPTNSGSAADRAPGSAAVAGAPRPGTRPGCAGFAARDFAHGLDGPAALHALGPRLGDLAARRRAGRIVPGLDQQPVRFACALASATVDAHQVPASAQLLALERELEMALAILLHRVAALGDPAPAVPQEHRAASVLALGNRALETAVLERMVLDLDRQALFRRVEARTLGHGPAPQNAFHLEAEVVVQPGGRVLLDEVAQRGPAGAVLLARGLGGLMKVPLAPILTQSHCAASGGRRAGGPSSWLPPPGHGRFPGPETGGAR